MTSSRASPVITRWVKSVPAVAEQRHGAPDRRLAVVLGRHAAPREPSSPSGFRWFLLAWILTFLVLTANAPGRMIFDTKLGVDIDPARFYAGLWHLWDPREWLGTLQDQYVGYAVPMAPFYLVGYLLHVPVWITERLWMSLLAALGFWGVVRLAAALRIGSDASRLLAGAVFALWPTFTVVIGSTSAAVIPGMLAPWAVLPLVSGAQRGSALVAAARSAAVIVCMGGVNAVSTIDALVLPALFILAGPARRRRTRLAVSWAGCVVAATSWWTVPLLLQGGYSFNFLPYIEQAATTTKTLSATTFLRGTGNWTAYVNFGGPWLTAGWTMVTSSVAILASAIAAATGLYGIARRDMPQARWLRLSIAVSALGALAAYRGPLGGPLHSPLLRLLDGPLAPFRNLYKLEPVLAVAVALGIAHAASRYFGRAVSGPGWFRRVHRALSPHRPAARVAAAGGAVFVLAGLALPYLSGQILQPGSFRHIPRYWYQAAAFLASRSTNTTALVVPATAHGIYLWGDPIDEPLESLARSPWAERALVPYGGGGSQTLLSTAENAIESGDDVPGLAAYLKRAGMRYVVVRNDLKPGAVGYTPPQIVHATLSLSGFQRVASFGPQIAAAAPAGPPGSPQLSSFLPRYPAVEVYQAAEPAQRAAGPATVLPLSQTALVNGGPDSLLQLAGEGTLGSEPAVIAGDPLAARPSRWLVTDGLRRADNAFGLVNSNVSFTYTATERNPADDPLGGAGGPPRQLLPVPANGHQTVAVLSGAARIVASSYGSWLTEMPQYDPVNAFDGNPATAWTEGDPGTPVGQWVQITFDHTLTLPGQIGVRLLDDSPFRAIARGVEVSTARGRAATTLQATNAVQYLHVQPGRSAWLRVTITAASRSVPGGAGAGIRDVLIPGVNVARYLRPAQDPAGTRAPAVAFSFHQQVPAPSTLADPAAQPPLARVFSVPGTASFRITATARALPGAALDHVLASLVPASRSSLQVSASSTLSSLPGSAAGNLFRRASTAPWIANSRTAVIHLSWHGQRRIDRMTLEPAYGISAPPESVRITGRNGSRQTDLAPDGSAEFVPALTTDRLDVSFPTVQPIEAVNPLSGQPTPLPVGLRKLYIPALAGLRVVTPHAASRFSLACGRGPVLTIDGHRYLTSVSGTVGALSRFLPVRVNLCGGSRGVLFGSGRHWLTTAAPGLFAVTDVTMVNGAQPSARATGAGHACCGSPPRVLDVFSWNAENRQLGVGPGPASYLEVHENANPGWAASLNGHRLRPVRLDGWQQGFVIPAGQGGIVTLTFTPSTLYHAALVFSALVVIALLVIAARGRGQSHDGRAATTAWSEWFDSQSAASRRAVVRRGTVWLTVLALCGLVFVLGGPVVLAVPVVAVVARKRPGLAAPMAFCAMVMAGLFAATAARPTVMGSGSFGAPAQAFALIGLAAALMPPLEEAGGSLLPERLRNVNPPQRLRGWQPLQRALRSRPVRRILRWRQGG